MNDFKYEILKKIIRPVGHNDIREVDLTVKCIVKWSDKIVADYDSETDTVLEYTSGYVLTVLPDQKFVYKNQPSTFLASVIGEDEI